MFDKRTATASPAEIPSKKVLPSLKQPSARVKTSPLRLVASPLPPPPPLAPAPSPKILEGDINESIDDGEEEGVAATPPFGDRFEEARE